MKSTLLVVKKPFTAREAADVVDVSNRFQSEISFCQPSKNINGKSLMGMISLGLRTGDECTLVAKGCDEAEAVQAIAKLFN